MSGVPRGTGAPEPLSADVNGVGVLTLQLSDGDGDGYDDGIGYDQGDWADPLLSST